MHLKPLFHNTSRRDEWRCLPSKFGVGTIYFLSPIPQVVVSPHVSMSVLVLIFVFFALQMQGCCCCSVFINVVVAVFVHSTWSAASRILFQWRFRRHCTITFTSRPTATGMRTPIRVLSKKWQCYVSSTKKRANHAWKRAIREALSFIMTGRSVVE